MMEIKLKEASLTNYEAKSYLALLGLGASTGMEISKKSGVPKTRVYDILEGLINKGLVNLIQEKPMVFKAINPEIGLKQLFKRKIEKTKEAEKEIISSLKKIKARPEEKPKIHEKITTVLGYERMYNMFIELAGVAKKEISVFSVGEKIPYPARIALKRAVARGVNCRLIATKYDEENKLALKNHIIDGWKIKHHPSTGEWTFAIIDKKHAMINVRSPEVKEERISIFFEIPGMAKALADYFDSIWKLAKPIRK